MKQKPIMPKEHFDAIAAQLGGKETLKATARKADTPSKQRTPEIIDLKANYEDSMRILKENGLSPLTYQEAFVHLMKNPGLMKQLKGKWFYLASVGFDANGHSGHHTVANNGNLTKGKGSFEQTVYICSGSHPVSLNVRRDHNARISDARFCLNATDTPDYIARVVVGVSKT